MNIFHKVNHFRRVSLRRITRNIGKSRTLPDKNAAKNLQVKRVLISRPNNRLGNLLLITPLLQEVSHTFPDCRIDLFVRGGLAPILFKNYEHVANVIELPKKPFQSLFSYMWGWIRLKNYHYDLVINVVNYSSSGRLSTQFSRAKLKIFGELNEEIRVKHEDYDHIAKHPVYTFRNYLETLGFEAKKGQIPSLDLKLDSDELVKGEKILQQLVHNDRETICIFTYATGRKCHSKEWWSEFYEKLKAEFKDFNIIEVLPQENISQIDFQATSFYSQDVREIGAVIANSALFIGADSGIMHLASAAKTPTLGLFSVSDEKKYQPYNNKNLSLNTTHTSITNCMDTIHKILGD